MLERTQYSLSRAGVMIGVLALVVLLASASWWWKASHREVPSVYFDQQAWKRVSLALEHVQPEAATSSTPATASAAACGSSAQEYATLVLLTERFNRQLQQAHKEQYLRQRYALSLPALLNAPEFQALGCRQMVPTLVWLTQGGTTGSEPLLQKLNWKERLPSGVQARWATNHWVTVSQASWTSRSPWSGLPGCVLWTSVADAKALSPQGDGARDKLCQSNAQASFAPVNLPGMDDLLTRVSPWRNPQHPLYDNLVGDHNRIRVRGNEQPIGLHVQLSFDPQWQRVGQNLAECYSGRLDDPQCQRMALDQNYYERARARMVGIAVMDIDSGRVLTAASSSSPCHAFDQTRRGAQPSGCPALDEGTAFRPRTPQETPNHALFTQAPPGSLVKPLMMAGILSQGKTGGSTEGLDAALQRSDSQRFLDAFLCRQQLGKGSFMPGCLRPEKTLEAAHRTGWNTGCDAQTDRALSQCGKIDLLHGVPLAATPAGLEEKYIQAGLFQPIQWTTLMGQMLVHPQERPGAPARMADMNLDSALPTTEVIAQCARSGTKGYSRCQGARLGLISEAYGQGNARATPVGVAGMLATLANSAQKRPTRYPHVLEGLWLQDFSRAAPSDRPLRQGLPQGPEGLPAELSQRILQAMEKTHTPGGTAYPACAKVMGASACRSDLGVAGKTGTPGDVDDRSLEQLHRTHQSLTRCLAARGEKCHESHPPARPRYRWYAAVFKSNGSDHYDKAIAVLVHSNWRRQDGRFADEQSAAIELAMRYIQSVRNLPPTSSTASSASLP